MLEPSCTSLQGSTVTYSQFCELLVKPLVCWNQPWKLATEISKHYKSGLFVFQEPVYPYTTMYNLQDLVTSYKEQLGAVRCCGA